MKKSIIMMVTVLMLVGYGQVIAATQYTISDLGTLFQIPSTSSELVCTTFELVPNQQYQIQVQGTYQYNLESYGGYLADAAWVYDGRFGIWAEELVDYPPHILELFVNEQPQDWLGTIDGKTFLAHTYSPSHVYNLNFIGTGAPISFNIYDSAYGDNNGSVQVSITPVPEPATLALFGLGGLMRRRRIKGCA